MESAAARRVLRVLPIIALQKKSLLRCIEEVRTMLAHNTVTVQHELACYGVVHCRATTLFVTSYFNLTVRSQVYGQTV